VDVGLKEAQLQKITQLCSEQGSIAKGAEFAMPVAK
jgi:hypothetical protein